MATKKSTSKKAAKKPAKKYAKKAATKAAAKTTGIRLPPPPPPPPSACVTKCYRAYVACLHSGVDKKLCNLRYFRCMLNCMRFSPSDIDQVLKP
ncbi:MAG: hypothetical protein QOJ64_468 [Acidobacteriota bacterium]|jgi:hypothetical protein|nr:hypothetical protein [Acidobacteriota bacterium]